MFFICKTNFTIENLKEAGNEKSCLVFLLLMFCLMVSFASAFPVTVQLAGGVTATIDHECPVNLKCHKYSISIEDTRTSRPRIVSITLANPPTDTDPATIFSPYCDVAGWSAYCPDVNASAVASVTFMASSNANYLTVGTDVFGHARGWYFND